MHYGEMKICSNCFNLYGVFHKDAVAHYQKCHYRCEKAQSQPSYPDSEGKRNSWPHFDFNKGFELCHCCGQEVLESGSRWSVWFCGHCKENVVKLNEAYGQVIIPIGRHSMMHGMGLSGKDMKNPQGKTNFVFQVKGLSQATDHLDEWRKLNVEKNCRVAGLDAISDINLNDYLSSIIESGLSKGEAFKDLCKFFEFDLK